MFDTAPSIIGDISCNDALPIQETLTASDACGTALVNPRVDPFVEDNCNGYTVTYRWIARDACGNETEVFQTFNVLGDSEAPTFDTQPNTISDISCNDPCLLYTSPSPRDATLSRMPSSA